MIGPLMLCFVRLSSESAALAVQVDTLRLAVGSPRVDGRVYRPHVGRVVQIRIAGEKLDTTAVWTNRLTIGDSAGRAVHRWHTKGYAVMPGGARRTFDLWSTFDATTLAPYGYHRRGANGSLAIQLQIDGASIRGSVKTPSDAAPRTVDLRLPRAGFAAGAADLIPYAVGLHQGLVMTMPLWTPPGEKVETEIWKVTRRTPITVQGHTVPSWEMEHYRQTDGQLLGRVYFVDDPPYVVQWDNFIGDSVTVRMLGFDEPAE